VLSDEIETAMRLIGARSLDQLNGSFVNSKKLELELVDTLGEVPSGPRLPSKL